MKLLMLDSDGRNAWVLNGKTPLPPSRPGDRVVIESNFAGPMAVTGVAINADAVKTIGPEGIRGALDRLVGTWRVDSFEVDGVISEAALGALEAQALATDNAASLTVHGDFSVGSHVRIVATNVGDTPAYFYAACLMEEIH